MAEFDIAPPEETYSEEPLQETNREDEDVESRREQMTEVFNLFDKNHDGSIDIKELGDGLRALGGNPTDAEIKEMMKEADSQVNPSGRLEFNEFFDLMSGHVKSRKEEEDSLREAFRCFDRSGDGRIDKKELREALISVGLSQLTNEEVDELFDQADKDNSGFIDYQELVTVLTNSNN